MFRFYERLPDISCFDCDTIFFEEFLMFDNGGWSLVHMWFDTQEHQYRINHSYRCGSYHEKKYSRIDEFFDETRKLFWVPLPKEPSHDDR